MKDESVASPPQRQLVGRWLAAFGVIAIASLTLTPSSTPLEDFGDPFCIVCGSVGGVDVVLNVLLFLPLGVGLALASVRASRAVAAMAAFTITIECLQFVVPGRDPSIGDVLMNVAGGALGFGIGRWYEQLLTPTRATARTLALGWAALWLAVLLVSSYALTPRAPDARYFGQIAPTLAGASTFHGHVSNPTVNDEAIADGELTEAQSAHLRVALDTGALVRARVTATDSTPLIAPILRIADDQQRELMILAQQESSIVFGVHTGADVLKLRPVRLRLHDALAEARSPAMTDSVRLEAEYSRSQVFLRARAGDATRELELLVHASDGWRLAAPAQLYLEDSRWNAVLSGVWMLLLALPLGYWGVVASMTDGGGTRAAGRAAFGAILLGLLAIGLSVTPLAFGIAAGSVRDWSVSLAGALLGAALSVAAQRSRSSASSTAAIS